MVPLSSLRISRVRTYFGYCRLLSCFPYKTLTFFGGLSHALRVHLILPFSVHNPKSISTLGLASFAFARRYSRNLVWSLFLCLLRCFSSAGSLYIPMDSVCTSRGCSREGCPIRISADLGLFAAPRSFSQLVTSFFGFRCQGILLALFLAWTSWVPQIFLVQSVFLVFLSLPLCSFVVLFTLTNSQPFLFSCLSLRKIHSLAFCYTRFAFSNLCLIQFSRYILGIFLPVGWLKWARTTDLALIRRAL